MDTILYHSVEGVVTRVYFGLLGEELSQEQIDLLSIYISEIQKTEHEVGFYFEAPIMHRRKLLEVLDEAEIDTNISKRGFFTYGYRGVLSEMPQLQALLREVWPFNRLLFMVGNRSDIDGLSSDL